MPDKPSPKGVPKKYLVPVGVAVAILAVLILRKKKTSEAKATEPGSEGLTNQSFIPVTGQNVPGVGAGNYGSQGESNSLFQQLFTSSQQQQRESNERFEQYMQGRDLATQQGQEAERTFLKEILANLGTGGGAPSAALGGGVVPVPPPETQPAPPPPPPPPPAPVPPPPPAPPPPRNPCPADFPNQGPHGCWRWSRTKTGAGCSCHGYQNGTLECEHTVNGRCTF